MSQKQPINPFYVALLPLGVLFVVTACALGVLMVQDLSPQRAEPTGLLALIQRHGGMIMGGELSLLGVLTLAAIASDDFWSRRAEARPDATKE